MHSDIVRVQGNDHGRHDGMTPTPGHGLLDRYRLCESTLKLGTRLLPTQTQARLSLERTAS